MRKTLTLLFGLLALPALVKGREKFPEDASEGTVDPRDDDASPPAVDASPGRALEGGVNLQAVANTLDAVTEALGRIDPAQDDPGRSEDPRQRIRLPGRWRRRFGGMRGR